MDYFLKFLQSLKRKDNISLIESITLGYSTIFENEQKSDKPSIRILTTYESLDSILKSGFIYSRPELVKISEYLDDSIVKNKGLDEGDAKWWKERKENNMKMFGTDTLIFCTVDWLNDRGHETGHGGVMMYLKPSIYDDFKLTMTQEDSLGNGYDKKVMNEKDIIKIGNLIKSGKPTGVAKEILKNIEHKNESGFFDKYAEVQIHTTKIPISYIERIIFTDKYLKASGDEDMKEKALKRLKKQKGIIVDIT